MVPLALRKRTVVRSAVLFLLATVGLGLLVGRLLAPPRVDEYACAHGTDTALLESQPVYLARRDAFEAHMALLPRPPAGSARLPFLYVTAVSSNHYRWMLNLIANIRQIDPGVPHLVVDLGLTHVQRAWMAAVEGVTVQVFNYSEYPPYFDINVNAGKFAFKPVIVEAALELADIVVWLDSGNLLTIPLSAHADKIREAGFVSGFSGGTVETWTHPGMLRYFGIGPTDPIRKEWNCNAATLMFYREKTLNDLVRPWVSCAMDLGCIAPPGSNRKNHRQDQAAITVLVHLAGGRYGDCRRSPLHDSVRVHQEDDKVDPDRRWHEGVGRPASLDRLVWHRFWLANELTTLSDGLFKLWTRLERQSAIPAIAMPPTSVPNGPAAVTVVDVLAHLFTLAAPSGGKGMVVHLPDGNGTSADAHLASLIHARILQGFLGWDDSLVTLGRAPLASLRDELAPYGGSELFAPAEAADVDGQLCTAAPPVEASHSTRETVVSPRRLRQACSHAGPYLVHLSLDAPSAAYWDWLGDMDGRLGPCLNPAVLLAYVRPGDGHPAPSTHLEQLLSAGWNQFPTVLAWFTPPESPPSAARAAHGRGSGCVRHWTAEGLARFQSVAKAAQLQSAAYVVGAGEAAGCLLIAISPSIPAPAHFKWLDKL